MQKCKSQNFCGYSRSDLGFVYQKCVCPHNSNCRFHDSSQYIENVVELMYNGSGYIANCENDFEYWYDNDLFVRNIYIF